MLPVNTLACIYTCSLNYSIYQILIVCCIERTCKNHFHTVESTFSSPFGQYQNVGRQKGKEVRSFISSCCHMLTNEQDKHKIYNADHWYFYLSSLFHLQGTKVSVYIFISRKTTLIKDLQHVNQMAR